MMLTLPYHWTNVLIKSQQQLQIPRRTDFMPFRRRRQKIGSPLFLPMNAIVVRVCRALGHCWNPISLSLSLCVSQSVS